MGANHTFLLRTSLVLGMVCAVVTVLYFTPMPEQSFLSCDRPCHELDWPMICRIKLNFEVYQTMSRFCQDCPKNVSHCNAHQCASADGVHRNILTANRQLPGPSIQVCHNDILVVDVINKIPGQEVTVHWRGQPQHEVPTMDGVPMITQCPISSYTTFQYKFRASAVGTHLWHAHSGSQEVDGLMGALVVRQPERKEPHRRLYDVDDKKHVLVISEWNHLIATNLWDKPKVPINYLINGKGPSDRGTSLSIFKIEPGKRYRFRVAFGGGTSGCPVNLSVDDHRLKVIALDGHPTAPYEVTSVTLSKGERIDFVLKTNRQVGTYFLRLSSECHGHDVSGIALLTYVSDKEEMIGGNEADTMMQETEKMLNHGGEDIEHHHVGEKSRKFSTGVCDSSLGKVCLGDVQSLRKMPLKLRNDEVDSRLYLTYSHNVVLEDVSSLQRKIFAVNNISFTFPSSPLLSQFEDNQLSLFCNEDKKPARCKDRIVCECVHLEKLKVGDAVELLLINSGEISEQVFHLHGYHFYVVGGRKFSEPVDLNTVKELDKVGQLFVRNFHSPVLKDTIRLPRHGVIAVRFIADNPGFWMLRDENSVHWSRGMDVVLQVGKHRDMAPVPSYFPKCGNWIGPDFFLI